MEPKDFIGYLSDLMLIVALAHIINAWAGWKWGNMSRRTWVKRVFYSAAAIILILSLWRIAAYFLWYQNLFLKLAFATLGTVMVLMDTTVFVLATRIMSQRVKRLPTLPLDDPFAGRSAATLGTLIEELEARGRSHGYL
jgi:hypothetical protein